MTNFSDGIERERERERERRSAFFNLTPIKIETGIFLYVSFLFIFLLFPYKTFAVAPSTGLVGDWDPALITGLNDGDAVDTLPEAIAGKNATSTGTARPIYKTSIASYPVLLFDGTNDYLQTSAMTTVNQPYTMFMVFRPLRMNVGDRFTDGKTVNKNVISAQPFDINFFGLSWGTRLYSLYAGSAFSATNPGGSLTETGQTFGIIRAKFNGASSEISINRNTPTVGNPGSSGFDGLTIGGSASASLFANFYLARILVYNSSLVSASAVEDYLASQYPLTVPNLLIADGDSLTRGNGSSGYFADLSGSYPSQLVTLLGSAWTMANTGVAGQTTVEMETDAATEIDAQLNTLSTHKVLSAWGGTNDIYFGASAATAYSNYVTYLTHRRAAGWKVIAFTALPRSAGGEPGTFEASRQTFNTSVRTNWQTFADEFVDIAADSRVGDAGDETNTTYYNADRVHLNNTGYGIVAAAVKTQVDNVTDTVAPTVSVTAPTAAATVSGASVALTASASDNLSDLRGVQFKLDTNTNIGAEDTTSTYGVTWDSTAVADGSHTIIAVARDGAGNSATSSAITITVDNTAPVRSAGSPSGTLAFGTTGATLSLTTNENATCKYGTVSGTAYASIADTFTTTGGTSHSASLTGLSNDTSYTYYVRCQDGQSNNNSTDYTISFSVAADATVPTVSITAPIDGATVSGSTINISADASDNDAVAGVKFYYDDTNQIGIEDTSSPYSVVWDSTIVSDGPHTLSAVARDNIGNVATSSNINITVHNSVPASSSGSRRSVNRYDILPYTNYTTTPTVCNPGERFNTITGQLCVSTAITPTSCLVGHLFSITTGLPCTQTITNATLPSSNCSISSLILKQGDRGPGVTCLQTLLNILPVDGIFGPQTKATVIIFQKSKGLVQDGIMGPKTRASLVSF